MKKMIECGFHQQVNQRKIYGWERWFEQKERLASNPPRWDSFRNRKPITYSLVDRNGVLKGRRPDFNPASWDFHQQQTGISTYLIWQKWSFTGQQLGNPILQLKKNTPNKGSQILLWYDSTIKPFFYLGGLRFGRKYWAWHPNQAVVWSSHLVCFFEPMDDDSIDSHIWNHRPNNWIKFFTQCFYDRHWFPNQKVKVGEGTWTRHGISGMFH